MARIRTIKPSFFQSDDVSALPLRARLTWIGLWTQCDDQGRTKDHTRLIKAAIWPLDNVSLADIEEDLIALSEAGRIVRYEVHGQRYLAIVNWDVHQSINRPTPSRIPAPPINTMNGHGPLSEDSYREGKGKEGKGGDAHARVSPPPPDGGPTPPNRYCTRHPTGTDDDCRACGRARKAHEAWHANKRARIEAEPDCPRHEGEIARNCRACAADRKAGAA